jgi:hypothetical protein
MLIFNRAQLEKVSTELASHYNDYRPKVLSVNWRRWAPAANHCESMLRIRASSVGSTRSGDSSMSTGLWH